MGRISWSDKLIRLVLFLVIFCLEYSSLKSNVVVCEDCEINSISEAIEIAEVGETVFVSRGTYRESRIQIRKSVRIIGKNFPLIISEDGETIFEIEARDVIISGLVLTGVETSYTEDRSAIRTYKSRNITISNNKIEDCFFGIFLAHTKRSIVKDNIILGKAERESSSGNAIHCWYSENVLISGNQTKNHRDGIYLEFVSNSSVTNNTSEGHLRYGLHFMFSNDNKYLDNLFRNNGAGVAVMFSSRIIMKGNKFFENWGSSSYGLLLKEIKDGEISNNLFSKNTIGIFAESAARLDIKHNDFGYNGWALKISSSCEDLHFSYNNFSGNTFELAVNKGNKNYNKYEYNYWSNYSGYDLDRDGIGDIPHRPVEMFSVVVSESPASIILLRSSFVDIINYAEKVMPWLTPSNLTDDKPLMKEITHD
jgi:nitrous oxidase accessory protein